MRELLSKKLTKNIANSGAVTKMWELLSNKLTKNVANSGVAANS